jgi:protein-tyrosine phosphatase
MSLTRIAAAPGAAPGSTAEPAPLVGAPNFRSIAPLPAAGGSRLRPRRVFRSDALHKLTDPDLEQVAALGIDTVLDLRRDDERRAMPSRWRTPEPPRTLVFDSPPELAAVQAGAWRDGLLDPSFGPEQAFAWMIDTYRRMPRALLPAVRAALARAAGIDGEPETVLVHCTAGKDRTGFVCAMLLEALEVPREAIVEDYLESARRRPPEALAEALLAWSGATPSARGVAAVRTIAGVDPAFLGAAYDALERDWGSVPAYLREAGLDAPGRARLRAALLD